MMGMRNGRKLMIAMMITALAVAMSLLTACGGPKVAGTWYQSAEDTVSITLDKNGTFSGAYGSGNYVVDEDTLLLRFTSGLALLDEGEKVMTIEEENGETVLKYKDEVYYNSRQQAEAAYARMLEAYVELCKETIVGSWQEYHSSEHPDLITVHDDLTYEIKEYDSLSEEYDTKEGSIKAEVTDQGVQMSAEISNSVIESSAIAAKIKLIEENPDMMPVDLLTAFNHSFHQFERVQ